ncbi:30S ribosomal protein S12 methylthiotransferase RimO [Campylobacter hyointestinalis]|uniref:Ribosomal protein uS12 methylthiotransferase RimO n=1 Tax=Campylobacter hyointestinalis subsp. hyointestinalis TaxID=91352 RepID=A0A855N4Y2_CAMHY|nr:30S ribosomal protein S12 methylthiotransferase RimO [Campylobacter hyointestinalis]ANE32991.1 radical SAM methylthiotransferase, MiaB/RimO family [Campylobacter hyointestinalis subsp. hyointestinalis LMG 9260]PPB58702.1 30S ribosomal protein S12 methylthiotransferase RimO [Campylobacter hyointestinalis subsp. hyointestinalis]PPB63155.1 30S ribosomal protein S12 methylthiotransferase RimO [Campylobacter hyointestinalis subsp. hyointestinalis]PPB71511.1 30S ribosomal protein S12 methylthiotra
MPNLYLVSLGCNKNLVDSEIMLGRLSSYDIVDDPKNADVMIVNTCGFIESAKEESIRAILELASYKKENSVLVVTGCLMQRYRDELMRELPEVDIFSGVGDYAKIDELILKKQSLFSPEIYLQKSNTKRIITGSSYHAYIKIAEGCNQKCSFCAIPSFKGKLQSRSIESIADEVKALIKDGFSDFSFIAQDTSSFLRDFGIKNGLISLIDEIEKIDGIKTARILYLYPTTASFSLIERIIASPKFVNYFDMPIQHINDDMLKIMRRGSSKERLKELLHKMRNAKDSFLRTGVIVGHPGETDDRFDELCEFLSEFKFDRISAFAYSKEEDTLAYEMEQVSPKIITKRLNKIEKIIKKSIDESFKNLLNKTIKVQINGISSEGEMFFGAKSIVWDREIDGEILINDTQIKDPKVGEIYDCLITDFHGDKLLGTIIEH